MTVTSLQDQSSYIELIKTNPDFRNLWFAQLISAAGNWFNNVALLGLTLQLTNSGFATGLLLLVNQFPYFMWIPIAGPIIDRFDRKKVMVISNYVGAAAALVFLLVHSADMVWLIYLGIVVLSSSTAFFNPAATAIVPNLVDERELYPANTLSGSTWGIMVLVGSAVGGLISAEFGRDVVFWINSASFLVANLFLWRVKHVRAVPLDIGQPEKRSTWQDFKDGLAYVRTRPMVMILVACKSGLGLEGGVLILFTIFAEQIFKSGDSGVGWLYASRGLGSLVGPFLMQPFVSPLPAVMRRAIIVAFIIQGIGFLVFGISPLAGLWLAALAIGVGQVGGGIIWVASSVLVQQKVPDEFRGRVFAIDVGLSNFTNAVTTVMWTIALAWDASPVVLALLGGMILTGFGVVWGYISNHPEFK